MPHTVPDPTLRRGNDAPPPPARGRSTQPLPVHRPDPQSPPPEVPPPAPAKPGGVFGLSLTGILGGALAAVSAAALGARLGLAGTLVGAAIGSVVSAIAAGVYTHSLRTTRELIRTRTITSPRSGKVEVEQQTVREQRLAPGALRRVGAVAAILFVAGAVVVTGIELGVGRSLDGSGKTTVGEVVKRGSSGSVRPSSSPTSSTPAQSPTSTDAPNGTSTSGSDSPTSGTTTTDPGPSTTEPPSTQTSEPGSSSTATSTDSPTQPAGTPTQEQTTTTPPAAAGETLSAG